MHTTQIFPYAITLCIYVFILIGIGVIGYRTTKDLSDYILGGRKIGTVVTALSAGASDMSGWLLMGLPGAIFTYGLSKSWIIVGLFIGCFLNWTFVASKIRHQTEILGNAQTIPEYFANRFPAKGKLLRGISATIILIFFTLYCASGIVATARLLELGFNINYTYAALIGAVVTVFYVLIGGFFAVSWTDTFQAALMVLAFCVVPIISFMNIDDYHHAIQAITENNHLYTSFIGDITFLSLISSLAWGLGYFGQPHILVRFMAAADSGETITKARSISLIWTAICLVSSVTVGFLGAIYLQSVNGDIKIAENIFLELSKMLFNPWIAGILFAAVLSAIMSTLSCQLLLCSSAIVGDLLPLFKIKLQGKQAVHIGRIFLLLTAIVALYIALTPNNSILSIVGDAWSGFGSAFGALIILSLYRNDISADGALAGMITGAVIALSWEDIFGSDIYSLIPGFISSWIMIIAISRLKIFSV